MNRYRFPWREGNRFRLLIDGPEFFPAMLEAIHAAERYVLFETYLAESGRVADRFVEALTAAAARGVRTHLLLDDYGAGNFSRGDRERLIRAGVVMAAYNPLRYFEFHRNLFRDHRKILTVDGEVAFVGGAGITDDFDGGEDYWHDCMVRVEGPCVADWEVVFARNWERWHALDQPPSTVPPPLPDGISGRVVTSSSGNTEIKRSLVREMQKARKRIWLATAYFIPSRKLQRTLRRAALRGVDVRLLLPGPHTDHPAVRHAGRRFYSRLLRSGVRIFEYQPRFLHAKVALCDEWVTLGSSNMDRWNLRWNLEANQEARGGELASRVEALFRCDFEQSREYRYEQWHQRPWYRRVQEWFWGEIDLWLERMGQSGTARRLRHARARRKR